jgi:hypothetical protein
MAKISVGYSEFRRAYRKHSLFTGNSVSHFLILFYANECGLKSLICSPPRNGHKSKELEEAEQTHNLVNLLKLLRVPKSMFNPPQVRLQRDGNIVIVENVHQCWRYGIELNSLSEREFVEWLNKISNYIKQNI